MRKQPNLPEWAITKEHIYNTDVVKCPVWGKNFEYGTVFVMDEGTFTYTASFGANSDNSYSGCFFECFKVKTVQDAMKVLDAWIPIHLHSGAYTKRITFDEIINKVMGC